jgi:lipopolysaccharide/colanic/teichoic acid biosynthesis glycosyltransferase
MTISVLLVDSQLSHLPTESQSLLTLPLGTSSVLDHLITSFGDLVEKDVLVTAPWPVSPAYEQHIQDNASVPVKVLDTDGLMRAAHDFETSDFLLIVQARHWLLAGYDTPSIKRAFRDYHGATYGIAVGSDLEETRELVQHDASGQVKRVQRFYNTVNWPEVATTAIVYALVPGRALCNFKFSSLGELRSAMSARGLLSRDMALPTDSIDISTEGGFLAVHEGVLCDILEQKPPIDVPQFSPGVWAGPECQIHPSARLVPPIILHAGAVIEKDATIVGPAVIGKSCRVEENAAVIQSVLLADSVVQAGTTLRHRVTTGEVVDGQNHQSKLSISPEAVQLSRYRNLQLNAAQKGLSGKRVHLAAKRVIDILASAIALIMLSPLLLFVAILVKLDSPGPALFAHRRERRGGKDFACLKFRTMMEGAHQIQRELYRQNELDGPQFKMRRDPRVTRVGRWLRATNIDELPQLINVLLGHMSLVGPRPSPFRENQICVPWRRARLSVRPGITGLWQVCRDDDRSQADFHQWIYYDILYVRHFSIWLDIKILIATIFAVGCRWSVPMSWMIQKETRNSQIMRESVVA